MIDFKEKYKDLYSSVKDNPRRQLKAIPGEQRGDDLSSSFYSPYNSSDLSLFLLTQKTTSPGFIETYCLSDEDVERVKEIRQEANDNPLWKDTLINTLEQYLPMPYEEFKKLNLDEQQRIIDKIKINQGKEEKDIFQERFEKLFILPTRYSGKEKIKQEETKILKMKRN